MQTEPCHTLIYRLDTEAYMYFEKLEDEMKDVVVISKGKVKITA